MTNAYKLKQQQQTMASIFVNVTILNLQQQCRWYRQQQQQQKQL